MFSMQRKSRWINGLATVAPSALMLAGLFLASASVPARAADSDNDSIWNLDKKVWSEVRHGLGLRSEDDVDINYRERSPLVIPPSNDLPPPSSASAAQANADWPVDPDIKARKDRKKAEANYDVDIDSWGNPLLPSELNKGRVRASKNGRKETSDFDKAFEAFTPSQLGYTGGLFGMFKSEKKDEVATFKAEPPRTVLTEPPPGLQTPSSAYPYGATKRIEYGPNVPIDRQLEQ
jgi:hypothetical protein